MNRRGITIKAESLTGTKVQVVAYQAVALAKQLNCGVKVEFNGCQLDAWPHTTPADLVAEYDREVDSRLARLAREAAEVNFDPLTQEPRP